MKKIKVNNIILYLLGQILLSFGVVLAVKTNFGVTVSTSPAFVLSSHITSISFGTFNYLTQGAVFILMVIILRELKLKYLLSFGSSILFGYTIDLCSWLLRNYSSEGYLQKTIIFAVSIQLISIAVVCFIKSGLPMMPFDIFVQKISEKFQLKFGLVKLVYDISNLLIATSLSFIFFGKLIGVNIGTLVSTIAIGPCIGYYLPLLDRLLIVTRLSIRKESEIV